ncbi:MAG: LacI family DNA-binding transcriptional regulator [Victivallales bacterium]
MIRQYDIARKMGLSLAVVSRALSPERRRSDNLSEETRQSVRRVAAEMGYRKNLVAASLKQGRFKRLAFVTNGYESYMEMIRPMQKACRENGYELALFNLGHDELEIRRIFEYLIQGGFDGAVTFLYTWQSIADLAEEFLALHRPLVVVGAPPGIPEKPGLHCITVRIDQCIADACRHLYSLGHRKILCTAARFLSDEQTEDTSMKLSVVRKILPELGIRDWDPAFFFTPNPEHNMLCDGLAAAPRIVKEHPDVTAVICYNDFFAIGLAAGLRQMGKRVPEDISIIGSDNNAIGHCMNPKLTTLDLCLEDAAAAAISYIFTHLSMENSAIQPFQRKNENRESSENQNKQAQYGGKNGKFKNLWDGSSGTGVPRNLSFEGTLSIGESTAAPAKRINRNLTIEKGKQK